MEIPRQHMTSRRFNELRAGAKPQPEEQAEFEHQLRGKQRSEAAFRAVATKRKRYTRWPTRTHKDGSRHGTR